MKILDHDGYQVPNTEEAIARALDDHDTYVETDDKIWKLMLVAGFTDTGEILNCEFQLFKNGGFNRLYTNEKNAIQSFLILAGD